MFSDLIKIGFPKNCISCNNSLVKNETYLCGNCFFYIPKGELTMSSDGEIGNLFNHFDCFVGGSHLFDFDKEGKTQQILHELKYNSNINFGEYLGKLMGSEFKDLLKDIEYLIPVPLHPKKEHQRGFNQSLLLCKGLNSVLKTPISTKNLIRTRYTETQTKKNKSQRIENIKNAFEIKKPEEFIGKSVLLIDDVITTGSTLSECMAVLYEIEGIKISVLLLAKANY